MGRTALLALMAAATLAGCSGVDLRPISPALEQRAHLEDGTASGYVVYGPMVVVEVAPRAVCVARNDKNACTKEETRCAVGTPFALPDPTKPFLVDVRNGFGKAGVDLTIVDGWRLAGIKDQSDNTAILDTIQKLAAPLLATARRESTDQAECPKAGIYRLTIDKDGFALKKLLLYESK
ncbi:MAG: hypothetical protein ABI585_00705 [Betaproteobacteria bacterium]